ARRSRTTERSESVSVEAEYILYRIFCLRAGGAIFIHPKSPHNRLPHPCQHYKALKHCNIKKN
ncbi:hypothetical protein ACVGV4_02965, partial [Enterobacter hormaechei]